MADAALAVQLLIAFGGGVISFLSPCVLPLLPGYLSMMSGYSVEALQSGAVSKRRLLGVMLLFIAGFTVVFAAFGATATTLGRSLAANLNVATRVAGVVIAVFGLVLVYLAWSAKGALGPLGRYYRPDVRPSRLGGWAPPVMGAAFAFGWTPCIGPILTVVLATAATQATLPRGVALLVAYSLGLGLTFIISGLGLLRLIGRLKPHLRKLNIASGFLLSAFGVVMLTGNLSRLSAFFSDVITSIPFLERLAAV